MHKCFYLRPCIISVKVSRHWRSTVSKPFSARMVDTAARSTARLGLDEDWTSGLSMISEIRLNKIVDKTNRVCVQKLCCIFVLVFVVATFDIR